uniref:Syntaxin-binding protein 4 n=1 Tax=Lygus hesperus TaxID=30085 RepID=A0A0A9ZE99_LYGHE
MRASKIPMKVGDAAMKSSQRQSISRINRAEGATSAAKKALRMNQQQLQLMMDTNISQSLKTLIRNVSELQGSRKFEYLIPKPIVSKPATSVLKNTTTAGREMSCKFTSEEPKSESINKENINTSLVLSNTRSVNKTPMQRLAEAVRALTASVSAMGPLLKNGRYVPRTVKKLKVLTNCLN